MNKKELNTKQVGDLFGVDESTVRRWSISGKIKCASSAGGHRKFSYYNIIQFSKNHGAKFKQKKDIDVLDSKQIIKKITNLTLNHDSSSIESIFIGLYLQGIQLSDLMDNYVEKVLINIQSKLDTEKISTAEEHIARKIISRSLNNFRQSISNTKSKNNKNILCLNLENDIPDLPIDMIQILLENINYNVQNCGSHTSTENLKILLSKKEYEAIFIYLCNRQCCTSTVRDNIKKTNHDLNEIGKLAKKYKIKLFLGGPSFKNVDKENLKKYTRFTKYSEALSIVSN
jgi:methanogenic corrinoid protein MtbC1